MENIEIPNELNLTNLGKINVLLGRNGSGKSTLLRFIDQVRSGAGGCVRYITPERGGQLRAHGNVETNRASDPAWLPNMRRKNRYDQFRETSFSEFRNLETLVLRRIESDPETRKSDFNFEAILVDINKLLDRVEIHRADTAGFSLKHVGSDRDANTNELSSGESELVSLAIEVLLFAYLCQQSHHNETENILLLDEPDVHLHPDLQNRLMALLAEAVEGVNGTVLIATHSTTILASLCELADDVRVGFKSFGQTEIKFKSTSIELKQILPMFGAHPLSNVFNQRPPLIVEGEDDERIWQTAVRSSQGGIKVFPCVAGDIQSMNSYEVLASEVVESVYEHATVFSVRDRDEADGDLDDLGPVRRARLNCRAAENLILTDDVLRVLGVTWEEIRLEIEKWIDHDKGHSKIPYGVAFQASGFDRRNFGLKDIRNQIIALTGSNKSWEVAVGKAIAALPSSEFDGEHSLKNYLGPKLVGMLNLAG